MIVPDINLLIYAHDAGSPFHVKASNWWRTSLSGDEPVGLLQVVVFGFVRIATNIRVFQNPMTPSEAAVHVRAWLDQPPVQMLDSDDEHVRNVLGLLETLGTGGNLVTDASIAHRVIEYEAVLHTADTDFARFKGLRWFNPITEIEGGRPRRAKKS